MIDRIVYIGPYNNEKSNMLFNKALEYLKENKENKFYYILPNGKLLVKHRKRILKEVGQTFNINLFTFDNIVDRLLTDSFYINIDNEIKEALLKKVLQYLIDEGKITYYRDISSKKGFIKAVSDIIGEIKRSLISPDVFLDRCPKSPFYTEIGLMYEEYERELNKLNLLDREEGFLKSLEILRKGNSFFDGLDFIIIDYFFDFRPQELELLKEIAKTKCSIYINMPFNRPENFKTFTSTVEILRELGFTIEAVGKESYTYYDELANIVFSENNKTLYPNQNIHVIKAANSYLELKKISEEIKRHYSDGVDLKDMAIVITNPDKYNDRIFQVFEEERIPSNLDREISLSQIPLLEELVFILEVKKNHMDKNSIINRVKSNFFSLCTRDKREAFEYILRKEEYSSQIREELDCILKLIEEETKQIPEKGKLKEFIKVVRDFLKKYNVVERIMEIYNETKDYNLLNRDFLAFAKFNEILENMERFLSIIYDEVTIDEFIDLLATYLQDENIVEVEGNIDGINILTPVTARGQSFKVLFVLGLTQGDYPNIVNRNFFFKEDNYRYLKKIGIDVKNYYEILDKESLIFSTVISSCSDRLYLSYSQDSEEDESSIPSIFLDEILNKIEGDKVEDKVNMIIVNMDYILKDRCDSITTIDELSRYILRKYFDGDYEKELFYMYNDIDSTTFKEVNSRIKCEYERNNNKFNEYCGLIEEEEIVKDIKKSLEGKAYSISYLESYGKCPYYFMLNNLLKVEEMERAFEDFKPMDRGTINHEVLKEYYFNFSTQIKDYIINGKEFNVEDTYNFLLEKIKGKLNRIASNLDSAIWKLRIENNTDRLLNFIKEDLNRLSNLGEKTIPYDFEVPFGRDGRFELEIDGVKIPFTGVIDRIDKYVNDDKYIIIDYKNGSGSVRGMKEMLSGVSLQLPLYMLSQEDRNVVASMYGVISTGDFLVKIGNIDETEFISRRNSGALTAVQMNELFDITKKFIKSYIESIKKGVFSVNPRECSPYCIYKDICRYKDSLEVE